MRFAIVAIVLLLAACAAPAEPPEAPSSPEPPAVVVESPSHDPGVALLAEISAAMTDDPDGAVARCDELEEAGMQETCRWIFVSIKESKDEPVDPAFCEHFSGDQRSTCLGLNS